jgi:hypothetical protein
MLSIDIPQLPRPITYTDKVLLVGSCFTEHISDRLQQHKFSVVSNPNGILFNPLSVASAIDGYMDGRRYSHSDLFYLNELWNSWDHHTRFSDINADAALKGINGSQTRAAEYYLKETGMPVSNNHRAPGQWFEKRLLTIEEIVASTSATLEKLFNINPAANVLFTISPVRHIRDGVIENNRSKARLIEAVHTLCAQFEKAFYFPAYEIVIDVLRDYRYYDIDFVHPNYPATAYVWERFVSSCIAPATAVIMKQVQEITTAKAHRPRFPQTDAHRKFRDDYAAKVKVLTDNYPFLNLSEEAAFFAST